MADSIQVQFRCPDCNTRISWPDDAVESTKIVCQKCGTEFGTYGDLCNRARDAVIDRVKSIFTDALKRHR